MISPEVTGFSDAARVRDDCYRVFHVFLVMIDALRLVNRVKSALQLRIVRGDPCRAGILIALKSLDAAQREHEAACRHAEISPHAKCPGDICRRDQFAASDDLDTVL